MEDRGSERRTKRDVEAREAAVNEHTGPVCTGGQLLLLPPPFSPRSGSSSPPPARNTRVTLSTPCANAFIFGH